MWEIVFSRWRSARIRRAKPVSVTPSSTRNAALIVI